MKDMPKDAPEWLLKALAGVEEKAESLIRNHHDPSRAAGYFSAIQDFKDALDTEAKMEAGERKKRFRAIVHGES